MSLADVIEELANDTDFGRSGTIAWPATGGYNPATRTVAGTPLTPASALGILQSAKTQAVDGVSVLQGDRFFTIAASAVAQRPLEGGTVTFGSDVYAIVGVEERNAATLLGYRLQLRAARP